MRALQVQLGDSWEVLLQEQLESDWFALILDSLFREKQIGKTIFPRDRDIFRAFQLCAVDQVKVVLLGQDPYHGVGQATGLSFSVPKGIRVPPSLKNIYKELNRDLDYAVPVHGDLTPWATQGVLMLNAVLTVEANQAASHRRLGWMQFTDAVISTISSKLSQIVFLLWGNFAKQKKSLIDTDRHLVLESVHPSPLAGNLFVGNGHFSEANRYLESHGKGTINWQIL